MNNLKSILFSLTAIITLTVLLSSCEQNTVHDLTEEVAHLEEEVTAGSTQCCTNTKFDEIIEVLVQYGEDDEPVNRRVGRIGETLIIDGDIILADKYSDIESAKKGNILLHENWEWPNGIIPYQIDPSFSTSKRNQIRASMSYIMRNTNINYIPRTNESAYVNITPDPDLCSSNIGKLSDAYQPQSIKLSDNCSMRSVRHELLHTAGLYHEHQRTDRDAFINVYTSNINPEFVDNYYVPASNGAIDYSYYDFGSIMHYGDFDFALNNTNPSFTLTTSGSTHLNSLGLDLNDVGELNNMSDGDIQAINEMYQTCTRPSKSEFTIDGSDLKTIHYHSLPHQFAYRRAVKGSNWSYTGVARTNDVSLINTNFGCGNYYVLMRRKCGNTWSAWSTWKILSRC